MNQSYSSLCFCFLEYMRLGKYKRAQEIADQLLEIDKMLTYDEWKSNR